MLDEELTSLGFSDKERRFYLAAFESGAATVNDLASRAGVSRTNGYDLLGRLQSRGLLKTVPSSAGRLVVPEDPSVLSQDWERRRSTLNATIPKLRAMLESSGMRWSVRSYRGLADIERALKIWNERSRGEGLVYLGAMVSSDEGISAVTLQSILTLMTQQPGTQLMVSSHVSEAVRTELEGLPANYTDASAEGFVPAVAVLTEGDLVYIVSTGAEAYLLSIRSGSFAALARLLLTQLGTPGRHVTV